jgi:glycosyltransferase involved in cell wall biosynthesis
MKVSVIIPTYNYGRFIAEAIRSVQNQSYTDLEIIVIDDGSEDNTRDVLASIEDSRLRVFRKVNEGVSVARNKGIEMSRGELMAYLDADDIWRPDKLELQVAMFKAEPSLGLVFSDLARFNSQGPMSTTHFDYIPTLKQIPVRPAGVEGGYLIEGDTFEQLARVPILPSWVPTVVLRKSLVADIRFPPGVRLNEDLHYMLQVFRRVKAGYIDKPLVDVRRHGGNSFEHADEMLEPQIGVLMAIRQMDLTPRQFEALQWRLGSVHRALGYRSFWKGEPQEAVKSFIKALALPGKKLNALKYLAAIPLSVLIRALGKASH